MVLRAQGCSCRGGRDLETALPFLEKPLSMPGPQIPKTIFLKKPPSLVYLVLLLTCPKSKLWAPFVRILLVASDRSSIQTDLNEKRKCTSSCN